MSGCRKDSFSFDELSLPERGRSIVVDPVLGRRVEGCASADVDELPGGISPSLHDPHEIGPLDAPIIVGILSLWYRYLGEVLDEFGST